jgi:hypothetical protein
VTGLTAVFKHLAPRLSCGITRVVRPLTYSLREHLQQFLRYIRSSTKDVTLFLVVAPDFDSPAETQAQKLKAFSDEDTDVALITARDLKYMAEHWQEYSNQKSPSFSPSVLDLTGLLTRDLLIERLGWLVR